MLLKKGDTIILTGDSVTDCGRARGGDAGRDTVSDMGAGYPGMVKAYLNAFLPELELTVVNRGNSGDRTTDIISRMDGDHLSVRPDVVTLLIGINDVWRHYDGYVGQQVEPDEYRENMKKIIRALKTSAREVIVLTPFMVKADDGSGMYADAQKYAAIALEVAAEEGARSVALQPVFDAAMKKGSPKLYSADAVHPTVNGHALIAKEVLKALL